MKISVFPLFPLAVALLAAGPVHAPTLVVDNQHPRSSRTPGG